MSADHTHAVSQAALTPDDPEMPASRSLVKAIDDEIRRLELRIERLREAKANIQRRIKAA